LFILFFNALSQNTTTSLTQYRETAPISLRSRFHSDIPPFTISDLTPSRSRSCCDLFSLRSHSPSDLAFDPLRRIPLSSIGACVGSDSLNHRLDSLRLPLYRLFLFVFNPSRDCYSALKFDVVLWFFSDCCVS
jgi:hypothetical protein